MKIKHFIVSTLAFLFALTFSTMAFAQLSNYGFVIGTLNTTEYQSNDSSYINHPEDDPTQVAYGFEHMGSEGNFMHYYFFLNTPDDNSSTVYRIVIDFKDLDIYNPPYRIVNMRYANQTYYSNIFSNTQKKFYQINSHNYGSGALDYIRHPGILKDLAGGRPWQEQFTASSETSAYNQFWLNGSWSALQTYALPSDPYQLYADEIDALFENATRIIVFGTKFTNHGTGMHNVHQNQGNRLNNYTGNGYYYQDGGVIFEYPNGSRKLLMVKFGDYEKENHTEYNQIDFSYDVPPSGHSTAEGAPYTSELLEFDPDDYPNGRTFGPFYANQIEVVADNAEYDCMTYNDSDMFLSESPNVSDTYYRLFARNNGCVNEYLRSSKDLWNALGVSSSNNTRYYLFVKPYNMNSSIYIRVRYR